MIGLFVPVSLIWSGYDVTVYVNEGVDGINATEQDASLGVATTP